MAAWLARDSGRDDIDDLNGLGYQSPALATCILLLMLSLIGMPPLAGFFGKLYMFMEGLDENDPGRLTLMWLVALGLLNSVISAFYYVRVLKAMFLRRRARPALAPATSAISLPIVLATVVVVGFGLYPAPLMSLMKGRASPCSRRADASAGTTPRRPVPTPRPGPRPRARRRRRPSPLPRPCPRRRGRPETTPDAVETGSSLKTPSRAPDAPRRETQRRWPSSTPCRSASTAPTSSRTRRRRTGSAACWRRPAIGSRPPSNIQSTGQGDPADVSFLSYQAMFACLRALVYSKGYREAGLRCLLLACENLYVKPGLLDAEHIHAFERAQGMKTPPAENLAAASAFVKRTLEILGQ